MSKEKSEVEVLFLRDCGIANAGDVVKLPAAEAVAYAAQGAVDLHPDAIKAAKNK